MVQGVHQVHHLPRALRVAERGEGHRAHTAACVYWPPFSRTPGR
jgi:hypothetical protein